MVLVQLTAKTILILIEVSNRGKMPCLLPQQLTEFVMQMEFVLRHDQWQLLNWTRGTHLCWEVSAGFELLQSGWERYCREEQDDRPEEDIWNVGAMMTTGSPNKLTVKLFTLLSGTEKIVLF